MVELAQVSVADLVTDSRLQIDHDGTRNVLASLGLAEKCVEGIINDALVVVTGHATIGLDSMFEAVQFPAGYTGLDTGLTEMDADAFCSFVGLVD